MSKFSSPKKMKRKENSVKWRKNLHVLQIQELNQFVTSNDTFINLFYVKRDGGGWGNQF